MRHIFLILMFFVVTEMYAQQDPIFSNYYENEIIINPAISGSKSYNPLSIKARQQWLGFENAPLTSTISYHGALNNRSAMGGYLLFDRSFPSTQANLHLSYAYHVPLNYDKVNLSFGLGAKVMYYTLDFNSGDLPPGDDYAFSLSSYEKTVGDASSGIYLYGRNFYFGFSASNLFQSTFNTPISGSPYSNIKYRNYFGTGGYKFQIINNDWQLEPSFLIRKMQYQPNITDLNARLIFLEKTWASLSYRSSGSAIFGFGFTKGNMHLSYSYDHTFVGEIMNYNYGTHEIGITFRIETMSTQRHIGFWQ